MFTPEFSRPAQATFPVDSEMIKSSQSRQPFYQKLLGKITRLWEVEYIPPVVKTPDIYAFRFLIK